MIERIARRVLEKLAQEEIPLTVQALNDDIKEQLANSQRIDYAKPAAGSAAAGVGNPGKSLPLHDSVPSLSVNSATMSGQATDSMTGKSEAPVSLKTRHVAEMPKLPKVGGK